MLLNLRAMSRLGFSVTHACFCISSERLFSNLGPWTGLVQRNRRIFNQCSKKELLEHRMVPRSANQDKFSHPPGILEHFADSKHSIESVHHFSYTPDFLYSAHVSFRNAVRIDKIFKCGDSMIIHHKIPQFPMNCEHKLLSDFVDTSRKFLKLFSVSYEVFVLHGYDSISSSGKILKPNSVLAIVP